MAAGKTTVARALARRLGWRAEDVDELIEARERRPVADIFARAGEPYFRAIEREISRSCSPSATSSWPPAAARSSSRKTASPSTWTGSRSGSTCRSRWFWPGVPADGRRPLAADRAQMERLFASRRAAYGLAHLRIDVGTASADEIAEQIAEHMHG